MKHENGHQKFFNFQFHINRYNLSVTTKYENETGIFQFSIPIFMKL
ncbi:Uncharacterized protein dnm_092130 [Desulfonema magnum]|uniref:Uncharacterized protein n=1 Tax=Desulfonema magnum TaxID=45655 RepID=A0A975GTI5_9BACT|nr:Uncharacterized protein dnm_092130 [Desulfonema magnum]